MTSSQRPDQGSTLFEQLRSTVASVHFTSVYKLPPCVGHTKPFKKVPIFVCTKSSPFYSFFQYFNFISFILQGKLCLCGLCSDGENKHPKDSADYFNSSEQMCAILAHAIMLSSSQQSGFLSLFSIGKENMSGKMPDSLGITV